MKSASQVVTIHGLSFAGSEIVTDSRAFFPCASTGQLFGASRIPEMSFRVATLLRFSRESESARLRIARVCSRTPVRKSTEHPRHVCASTLRQPAKEALCPLSRPACRESAGRTSPLPATLRHPSRSVESIQETVGTFPVRPSPIPNLDTAIQKHHRSIPPAKPRLQVDETLSFLAGSSLQRSSTGHTISTHLSNALRSPNSPRQIWPPRAKFSSTMPVCAPASAARTAAAMPAGPPPTTRTSNRSCE